MVLDPIPQSLPVHFFGSRPQPSTSPLHSCHAMWHTCHVTHWRGECRVTWGSSGSNDVLIHSYLTRIQCYVWHVRTCAAVWQMFRWLVHSFIMMIYPYRVICSASPYALYGCIYGKCSDDLFTRSCVRHDSFIWHSENYCVVQNCAAVWQMFWWYVYDGLLLPPMCPTGMYAWRKYMNIHTNICTYMQNVDTCIEHT